MNTPAHFRFLLETIEYNARRTRPVLYPDSRNLWEDILEAWEHRETQRDFWIFCTRWIREEFLKVMRRGSPRALLGILSALRPDVSPPTMDAPAPAVKRRIIAILLPMMMREGVVRVRNAALDRGATTLQDEALAHPEDRTW